MENFAGGVEQGDKGFGATDVDTEKHGFIINR